LYVGNGTGHLNVYVWVLVGGWGGGVNEKCENATSGKNLNIQA